MARKTADWNEGLAQDLRDVDFAREFIRAAFEEGIDLQEILSKVVRAYGVNAFARKIRMAPPNLLRAIAPKANPTRETLARILKPFGLQLSVAPLNPRPGKRAA